MRYGESAFDIFYLLAAIITGVLILRKASDRSDQVVRLMGISVLVLGCGDAFHLVPRVLNYFLDADFTAALGIGKLVTSITMTVFYVLLYQIGCACFRVKEQRSVYLAVYVLAAVRIIICLFPQNGWIHNESSMLWGILRNIPFVALGIIVMALYYQNRAQIREFRHFWLWILLSFAFYMPVAVLAGVVPVLGMLMLPKTICYLAMIYGFYRYSLRS